MVLQRTARVSWHLVHGPSRPHRVVPSAAAEVDAHDVTRPTPRLDHFLGECPERGPASLGQLPQAPRPRAGLEHADDSLGVRGENPVSWTSSREMRPPRWSCCTPQSYHAYFITAVGSSASRTVCHLGGHGLGCAAATIRSRRRQTPPQPAGVPSPLCRHPQRLTFRPTPDRHVLRVFRHLRRVRPRVSRRGSRPGGSSARPRPPRGVSA